MSSKSKDPVALAQKQYKKAQKNAQKAAKRQAKADKRAAKHAVLSVHKRPIVCPPDKAGRSLPFRFFGYLCRVLVVWLAAAGLVTFISAAFDFGVPNKTIFLCTLLVVSLAAASLYNRWGVILASAGAVGSVAMVLVTRPSVITDVFYGILAMYNAALQRLYRVGYLAYVKYQVAYVTDTPTEELLATGVCLLSVIVGLTFAYCLIKRVRIIPPAILATTFLVVILTFNVYSNRIASNLGIALVIVSFATVLVMAAYDRLYRVKDAKRYDTGMNLFGDSDRPEYPPEYVAEQERKAAERAARKSSNKTARRALHRTAEKTVDEELSDYFGGKSKKKAKKAKPSAMSPAERKQKKAEARAIRRQVAAVKRYDRVTEQSRAAMGGFASAAAMLLALLIIALPALTVTGNFETIDAIDEKMAFARDYVTAVLRGDDARLDELEYSADRNNFQPHSTNLEQLEFTGKQIFYVESRYNTNYYLRGWIGTGYENGAWLAVDDTTLEAYRAMFDTDRSPGEEFRYQFYHYMMPSLVDDENYTEHYLTKYQSNLPYGFVTSLVSLRRVNSPSTMTYFPSVFKSGEGMFEYGSTTLSETTYVNYFDGIYTGRAFEENDASQATVTMAPVMTQENWSRNQAALIAAFNLQREVLLAKACITQNADGTINSNLTMYIEERPDGTTMFSYQTGRGKEQRTWRSYHDTKDVAREGSFVTVATENGTIQFTLAGNKVQTVDLLDGGHMSPESSLVYQYANTMTDAERSALMTYLSEYDGYTDFVYNTYTGTSDSEIIRELAGVIKAQAHTEYLQETVIEEPDDPETEEYDPYSYTKREWINLPADVSMAAVRNTGSADTYVQRDLLIRNVIDYIIYELGCEYSITPDTTNVDAALDGVENFLTKTKEGYCVQFASSAALILRELGIPARYVEGYIASELTKKGTGSDMSYGGYVRDYEAHAWIEVYFDGVGWIQYETTPQYYGGMYGIKSGDSIIPNDPVKPPELDTDKPKDPETLPPDVETESSTETDTGDGLPNDDSEAIMKGTLITLGVLVGIALVAGIIGSIVSSARRAEEQRQSVVSQVLESNFGTNVNEEDRREMSFSMVDSVNTLLKLYDLAPKPGEFRDEYADRLTAALNRPDERGKARETEAGVELPDLHLVMEAMAAEEFGHGMTVSEMKLMATFYLCLRREIKRRLPLSSRLYLRFIKRII
ncbi:MAG: hypothetical protein IJW00_10775 [Clostridia bacterium]|nr:hypothetical protein [Clostridia bacterium]